MKLIDIQKNAKISKEFPPTATVLASPGQLVEPTTPIAKHRIVCGYRIIEASKILKIKPNELKAYLKITEGQSIYAGEVLAERQVVFPKQTLRIQAPSGGHIQTIDTKHGTILIQLIGPSKTTPAGIWGKVNKITPLKNTTKVQLITDLAKLQAVAARGYTREGIINMATSRHENLEEYMINKDMEGKIIIVGRSITRKALLKAIKYQVSGIICGSLHYFDICKIAPQSDVGISILITEGFGEYSMNEDTYKYLKEYNHSYAIIVPSENAIYCALPPQYHFSEKNQSRRYKIIWGNQTGMIGECVQEIPAYRFSNGLECPAIELKTKDSRLVVPRSNVVVIE
jgi:hypothetical protein